MKKTILLLLVIIVSLSGCRGLEVKGVSKPMDILASSIVPVAKAARPISDEEEYYLGRAVAAKILSSYPLSKDTKVVEYVNMVGQTIALHSDKPYTYGGYHFAVLESDEINAFACPGGIIFITKGTINATRNEDELAAVLAHEVAHINNRDGVKSIKQSRWLEVVKIIGSKTVKEAGSERIPRLVKLFEGSINDVFKTLVVTGYSRSQEYAADTKALTYLSRAGYNPKALEDFLQRLYSQNRTSQRGILKTHPATMNRIKNVKKNMPVKTAAITPARTKRFNRIVK
jgi:predicted Zn-dependent protease